MENRDRLTGLFVQKHFEDRLEEEIARTRRYKRPLTLLLFQINYNHFMPDTKIRWVMVYSILRQFGEIMSEQLRNVDIIGRYGGEQFAIALPETDLEGGRIVAERIRREVAERVFTGDELNPELHVALDGGIASCPIHGRTKDELIASTKHALLRAQKWGGNVVVISSRQLYDEYGNPIIGKVGIDGEIPVVEELINAKEIK
jgi:diguanylate cyclase (GGDEF)-like protein